LNEGEAADQLLEDPIRLKIALHLHEAGVDYPYSIARSNDLDMEKVESELEEMMRTGLVKRGGASSVKRSDDAFKRSQEVHKHHTYYGLTRQGEMALREIKRRALRQAEKIRGTVLASALSRDTMPPPQVGRKLQDMGLVSIGDDGLQLTYLGRLVKWYLKEIGDRRIDQS